MGPDPAELGGRARRRDRAAQPLRQPDHRRPRRGPQAAVPLAVVALPRRLRLRGGRGGRVDHRPVLGRADDDLRERRAARRDASASRSATAARWPTSTSTCCARSACGWGPSTTTAAPTRRAPAGSGAIAFTLDPPAGDLGLRRALERFPFVPADPARLEQDCYEAYNIQVAGLQQRLRAIGDPKVVIGVSGGLDSTHALIVAARAMDRAGRPRSDILGFTLPGFATSEPDQGQRPRADGRARRHRGGARHHRRPRELMLEEIGHPLARGEEVYDVTFENVQAGLRTDYLFRIANQRGGIVLGTGDLSELALGWATYGVGDQMSHYNVNAGVPKTLIQHLIRWVVASAASSSDEVDETLTRDPRHGDQPGAGAGRGAAVDRVQDRPVRAARLHPLPRAALRLPARRRSASSPGTPGATPRRATWPPNFPEAKRAAYDQPEIRHWLEVFCKRFFALRAVQALGAAERPEGLARRLALAARRLARAVGRHRRRLAARPGALDALASAARRSCGRGRTGGPRRR